MKRILFILILLVSFFSFAQKSFIDVVYLNNGSIIKGLITEMDFNESITIRTDNGSILIVKVAEVKKVLKEERIVGEIGEEELDVKLSSEDEILIDEMDKPKKKKKGKFWKALGNIAVATLNRTAKNVKDNQSKNDDFSEDETSEMEDDFEIGDNEENNTNLGSICIINGNSYSRKIVLVNRQSGYEEVIVIGKAGYGKTTNSCAYDIPAGVYDCKVYTTFSKKLVEQYNLRIIANDEISRTLIKNHFN